MNTVITIKEVTVYGRPALYVVSDHKKAIEVLTGKKTIDQGDIEALKKLGFSFVREVDSNFQL